VIVNEIIGLRSAVLAFQQLMPPWCGAAAESGKLIFAGGVI
jgi:hypothetical protein